MNILIVGCGKVGSALATMLNDYGHDVSVVDRDASQFERLDPGFRGVTVAGVPMDKDVLRNAGIEACDALAAVTIDDNLNIMVSQMARKIFKVPKVIARVYDPAREDVFNHFGLTTVCPTRLTTDSLYTALLDEDEDHTITFQSCTLGFSARHVDRTIRGKTLDAVVLRPNEEIIGIRQQLGGVVFASNIPRDYTLKDTDRILFCRAVD